MPYKYRVIKEHHSSVEIGKYESYGIAAFIQSGDSYKQAEYIQDISESADFVNALAVKFTEMQLEPIHLADVIEDELSQLGYNNN